MRKGRLQPVLLQVVLQSVVAVTPWKMASAQVSTEGYALRRRWYKARAGGDDSGERKNDVAARGSQIHAAAERQHLVPSAAGGANETVLEYQERRAWFREQLRSQCRRRARSPDFVAVPVLESEPTEPRFSAFGRHSSQSELKPEYGKCGGSAACVLVFTCASQSGHALTCRAYSTYSFSD